MIDTFSQLGGLGQQFIDIHEEHSDAVLHTLKAGWERMSGVPEVHSGTGEVEITQRFRKGMRAALEDGTADWCKKMTVLPGTESSSSPDLPAPDGRTDIPILFTDIREKYDAHDPHAIVECKRVAGGCADLCREYVVEGIDRFVKQKYGANHAVGFMAGYLIRGNTQEATDCVNRHLTYKRRQREHLGPSTAPNASWAKSSYHRRPVDASPITLHHAFFGLPPTPP